MTAVKSFIKLVPGPTSLNIIRMYITNIYHKFVGKAKSLPWSGAPERYFILLSSSFTHKWDTWLKRPVRDKHSSLLQTFVNYGREKFSEIDTWGQCYKKFP